MCEGLENECNSKNYCHKYVASPTTHHTQSHNFHKTCRHCDFYNYIQTHIHIVEALNTNGCLKHIYTLFMIHLHLKYEGIKNMFFVTMKSTNISQ
jgi:hypothetical protein